ncbi:hypothetical protein B0J13DRAFT_520818 [Dactylonectria estremocensis]|uniref:Uncharacterized protein n=1 Tax=Dactylonectria estremocensis TaxID=1079267 RepID=A0A9P9FBB0_9HYPO|nr:hypothetical protein B0J13DRAFT_520818 [Dactylonectria estremocensis]
MRRTKGFGLRPSTVSSHDRPGLGKHHPHPHWHLRSTSTSAPTWTSARGPTLATREHWQASKEERGGQRTHDDAAGSRGQGPGFIQINYVKPLESQIPTNHGHRPCAPVGSIARVDGTNGSSWEKKKKSRGQVQCLVSQVLSGLLRGAIGYLKLRQGAYFQSREGGGSKVMKNRVQQHVLALLLFQWIEEGADPRASFVIRHRYPFGDNMGTCSSTPENTPASEAAQALMRGARMPGRGASCVAPTPDTT